MTIDELTHATVIHEDMRIPVSLFGQMMRISISQIHSAGGGTPAGVECMTPAEVTSLCNNIFNT